MSVMICSECEKHIDTDFEDGDYCPFCNAFTCENCYFDKHECKGEKE